MAEGIWKCAAEQGTAFQMTVIISEQIICMKGTKEKDIMNKIVKIAPFASKEDKLDLLTDALDALEDAGECIGEVLDVLEEINGR